MLDCKQYLLKASICKELKFVFFAKQKMGKAAF